MNPRLEQLRDPLIAQRFLGPHLAQGQLALFLGAGISQGLGLPDWGSLVTSCEQEAGLSPGSSHDTADGYMLRMDVVRRATSDGEFLDVVRRGLYGPDLMARGTFPTTITNLPLLSSLGALVMASRRGSVGEVFTLNFDDVLDWYLHLHGFRSQSVTDLPCLIDGSVDVRIYHLHGYLPLNKLHANSPDIVLTRQQFVARIAEESSAPWPALLLTTMMSKILIIVGTSLSDIDVAQLIERARVRVAGRNPLAFLIGAGIDENKAASLLEATIVPVSLADEGRIPDFLLRVCQEAAAA